MYILVACRILLLLTVCTDQVLLKYGWESSVDLWSVGCMLVEFLTSEMLFPVHDTPIQMTLVHNVCGRIPLKVSYCV